MPTPRIVALRDYNLDDVFSDLVNGIFAADLKTNVNVYRQYLQTNFVKGMIGIMDPRSPVYDEVAKAAALNSLRKIKAQLTAAVSPNEETKAHRANLIFLINDALNPK